MNLQKRKHFTPKKEGSFLMNLFLSYCFFYQTRKDLVLVKFCCNAAVRCFLKTFRKFAGNACEWDHFQESNSSFYQFSEQLFKGCFQKLSRKHIPLNDNIVWCKYSRVIKDLSKKWSFFLLNTPKFLGGRFFILSTRELYVFSEMYSSKQNP